jgi:hypothetical protein
MAKKFDELRQKMSPAFGLAGRALAIDVGGAPTCHGGPGRLPASHDRPVPVGQAMSACRSRQLDELHSERLRGFDHRGKRDARVRGIPIIASAIPPIPAMAHDSRMELEGLVRGLGTRQRLLQPTDPPWAPPPPPRP